MLGLDCVKIAIASGAPIQRSTVEFFMGLNIPLMDMYGSSENSGPQTISTISNWRLDSVGQSLNGTYLKIDNPDENGEGEVSNSTYCDVCNSRIAYLACLYLLDLLQLQQALHSSISMSLRPVVYTLSAYFAYFKQPAYPLDLTRVTLDVFSDTKLSSTHQTKPQQLHPQLYSYTSAKKKNANYYSKC